MIVFLAAATGLVIVALQIAYLPALYAAFNRTETQVALPNARGGVPSWGPELLARTQYALGSGMPTRDTMPGLYAEWERWAADIPDEPDEEAGIALTYEEFLDAVARMRGVDFPIERDPAEAWPEFVGWRVNYEQAAYALGAAVYAVPALWSGPRRHPVAPIAPVRPQRGRPQ